MCYIKHYVKCSTTNAVLKFKINSNLLFYIPVSLFTMCQKM